jgi:hypothetical protein
MEKKLFNNTRIKGNYIIWCLTHSDVLHPSLNSILGIFLYSIENQSYSYINFSHPDVEKTQNKSYFLDKLLLNPDSYIFNKKEILHKHPSENIDLDSIYYFENNIEIPYEELKTSAHLFFERKYKTNKINNIIPITKHLEYFKKLVEHVLPYISSSSDFYSNKVNKVIYQLEKNPLKINRKKFDKCFELTYEKNNLKDNYLYPYYNPFSTTGRLICSYNGLNLQTLNKENNCRESFIPSNDILVEIDYDGYHIRLIGDLIGYKFKEENIHLYLAKQYFGENPTPQQIKEAKELTFTQLYGGVFHRFTHIPFFKKVQEYVDMLWNTATIQGYIKTPLANRKIFLKNIKENNPYKLLNYVIQAYETERNILILEKILVCLKEYNSKFYLYVYDAFIFDIDETEKNIIPFLKQTISEDGKFPVKIKHSMNLNNFKPYD